MAPDDAPRDETPLFVDLDGTLIRTDLLAETFFLRVKSDPRILYLVPFWLLKGRAHLKRMLARDAALSVETLPYTGELVEILSAEAATGRPVYLATASDRQLADRVAAHLGTFRGVLGSDGRRNLKGVEKLRAIEALVGSEPFDYAGNGPEDIAIWAHARKALVVNAPPRLARRVRHHSPDVEILAPRPAWLWPAIKAMRPHQWLKNLLVFVPLVVSQQFGSAYAIAAALIAFLAFSLCASSTYVLNDLLDLAADRAHPRKRRRPLAAGDLPISYGVALSALAFLSAVALAAAVSPKLLAILLAYALVTVAYSWSLKSYVLVDVIVLSVLYTVRILAGAAAIEVTASFWLLAFSVFIFLSLALVKRCSELIGLERRLGVRAARGRDYGAGDLPVLQGLGAASGCTGVLVFALYIHDPVVAARYETPELLWLACLGLLYWVGRMWIKTGRGEMDDDPLVYAVKDRGTRIVLLGILAAVAGAMFLRL